MIVYGYTWQLVVIPTMIETTETSHLQTVILVSGDVPNRRIRYRRKTYTAPTPCCGHRCIQSAVLRKEDA